MSKHDAPTRGRKAREARRRAAKAMQRRLEADAAVDLADPALDVAPDVTAVDEPGRPAARRNGSVLAPPIAPAQSDVDAAPRSGWWRASSVAASCAS